MTLLPDTLRVLEWDGCLNARDTGGYPAKQGGTTRYGVLLRSDTLCRLTERGLEAFAAHGVQTVIDVRSSDELEESPNPFVASESVRYLNLPLFDENDGSAMARIKSDIALPAMYRVMLGHFGANIAAIVEAVTASDGAVVIHCYAGKDRTGLVVALLLAAVGVEDEDIIADYVTSHNGLQRARAARVAAAAPGARAGLEHRLGAEAATMRDVLNWLKSEYGGVEAYLLASGVSKTALTTLRQRLVAPRGGP